MSEKMLDLLDQLSDHYEDGIMCENESQIEKIWKIREGISLATAAYGLVSYHNLNLTLKSIDLKI